MTTETLTVAPELTPSETAYFDSGGKTEIEATETNTNQSGAGDGAGEGGDKTKTAPPEGFIDKRALDEERTRRRNAESASRKLENDLAELRGKFSIVEKLHSPQQQATQELTPETDIFGYAKKTNETVAELQKRLDQQDAGAKEQAARNQLVNTYRADAAKFAESTPDFGKAYDHLFLSRANELKALGYEDPQQIHDAIEADEYAIAEAALARKQSPAQVIYELAKQRGYARAAEPATSETDASKRLETIQRGQEANKSLSSTGGGSGGDDMTATALLKMPNDEFEAWCKKYPAKAKSIFGG